MKSNFIALFSSLLLAVAGLTSCSRAHTDAQITSEVQQRIHAETALNAQSIQVQANNGVVVLTGSATSEAARSLAENTSRQAQGVKGVVNNLQIVAATAPTLNEASPANEPVRVLKPPAIKRVIRTPSPPTAAPSAASPAQVAAPQSAPTMVTIPEGTALRVRLTDPVDTEKNKEGDTFRASLDAPIIVEDKIVVPRSSDVTVRLVSAKSAGHFTGASAVVLVLDTIGLGGKSYKVQTEEFAQQGGARGKRSAGMIGGGAAAGAVIGAIAGGGKGAAIGAAAGAGAGTGVQALTKGEQIKLPAETLLEFKLKAPLSVPPLNELENAR